MAPPRISWRSGPSSSKINRHICQQSRFPSHVIPIRILSHWGLVIDATMQLINNEPDISVVVPVFNGENTLKELFLRTRKVMLEIGLDFEVIFVDDGSADNSWKVIHELRMEFAERVRGFRLARNSGQHPATICGLRQARGKWALTLDDDLQSLPEDIPKLWRVAYGEQVDVVYGVYPAPRHDLMRNLGSR